MELTDHSLSSDSTIRYDFSDLNGVPSTEKIIFSFIFLIQIHYNSAKWNKTQTEKESAPKHLGLPQVDARFGCHALAIIHQTEQKALPSHPRSLEALIFDRLRCFRCPVLTTLFIIYRSTINLRYALYFEMTDVDIFIKNTDFSLAL